jgi:hypothetical protein
MWTEGTVGENECVGSTYVRWSRRSDCEGLAEAGLCFQFAQWIAGRRPGVLLQCCGSTENIEFLMSHVEGK